MKIVHVTPLYPPSIGGNQLHIANLSEKLAALGEEVIVYTANAVDLTDIHHPPQNGSPLPTEERINGVVVKRFPVNYRLYYFLFRFLYKIRGGYWLLNLFLKEFIEYWEHGPLTVKMLKALRQDKPDIVMVSNNYAFQSVVGYLAKTRLNLPFVFLPLTHSFHPWTHHPALKKILEKADTVLACTEFEKNFLVQQGIDREKISVHPLGIDFIKWMKTPKSMDIRQKYGLGRDPVIGYLGRKFEGKGIEHLIRAMRLVWKKCPQARLLLAGKTESSFQKVLESELNQLTQEELACVTIVDEVKEEDKKSFYAAMDVFVMVSNIDSFGLVYLEAWATEVPVVAAKNSPQASFIEQDKDGLLVDYADPADLAATLERLLADQCLRQEMGDRGNFKVESRFNIDYYAQSMVKEYRKLFADKQKRKQ